MNYLTSYQTRLLAVLGVLCVTSAGVAAAEQEAEILLTPLNDSGIWAKAAVKLTGRQLTLHIEASGLEPNKPHPQHIHGFDDPAKNAVCPGSAADTDGDGVVSVQEGAPFYGPILLPLPPFNLVDADGNLSYEVSFTVDPASVQPLHKRAIVMHGLTVNGTYIPSLPIACGALVINK